MKKFVVGDIHASFKGLMEVLKKSNFDINTDKIFFIGDIIDGWSESKELIDFILTLPNKVVIRGNHDEWALFYYKGLPHYANSVVDLDYSVWKAHGGRETIKSLGDIGQIDKKYIDFLESTVYYHEEDGNLFVHAGYSLDLDDNNDDALFPISQHHPYSLCWDRTFIREIYGNRKNINYDLKTNWKEVFIGHTPTTNFNNFYKKPQNWLNVWNMDTASAFDGKVSLMNIETKEVFQSEESRKLYPTERGRNELSWYETKWF